MVFIHLHFWTRHQGWLHIYKDGHHYILLHRVDILIITIMYIILNSSWSSAVVFIYLFSTGHQGRGGGKLERGTRLVG